MKSQPNTPSGHITKVMKVPAPTIQPGKAAPKANIKKNTKAFNGVFAITAKYC